MVCAQATYVHFIYRGPSEGSKFNSIINENIKGNLLLRAGSIEALRMLSKQICDSVISLIGMEYIYLIIPKYLRLNKQIYHMTEIEKI